MPSDNFRRTDMRHLAAALSNNTTHAGIGTFEMSLGLNTVGNKGDRANQVIRYIYEQSDTDALIIELLNYLYVENPYADTSELNTAYTQLLKNVLEPRGVSLTDNGFALSDGRDIDSLDRIERQPAPIPSSPSSMDAPFFARFEPKEKVNAPTAEPAPDRSKVFVVHGRDTRPVDVLKQYLLFLSLQMMPWSEAVRLTGESQPHTYDIVRAGIANAAAVIVIFSPDELARVKDDFSELDDPDRIPQGQARQNVLLEAGMAFVMAPKRTIFLKSAPTRDISDIAGFNWVKLDGNWDSRNDLKSRLETAGAAVRQGGYDLRDPLAGPFMAST